MIPNEAILSFYYSPKRWSPGAAADWPQFLHNLAINRFEGVTHYIPPPPNELGVTRFGLVKHFILPTQNELGQARYGRVEHYVLPDQNKLGMTRLERVKHYIFYLIKTSHA